MGGIGSAVRQSAGAFAALGHDVHVFTLALPHDARSNVPAGVTIHEIPDLASRVQNGTIPGPSTLSIQAGGDGIYRLALASLICDELRHVHQTTRFDIIEAPEVEALGLPLMLDRDFNAPIITHLHCCTALARKFNNTRSEDGDILLALEFAAIQLADAVCAPTQAVVQATRQFCGVPRDTKIIPHALTPAQSTVTAPPKHGPILFVGRLERLKGVEILTDALNLFLPRYPGAIFRFVAPDTCTGPARGSMQQFLESKLLPEIRSRVKFAGELTPDQIRAEWQSACFGVMPSIWENFSMAVCEAMAAGRAVVVADGTGSVEVIGDAGLICRQNSAESLCEKIETLWTDHSILQKLSRAAIERISTAFLPHRIATSRAGFYSECINNYENCDRSTLDQKIAGLPPQCIVAILPALVRITGTLAGVQTAIRTPGSRLLRVMEHIKQRDGEPAQILLYGAGKHTARLMSERSLWETRHHRVVGIIDDHARFAQTPVYLDLPVQSMGSASARIEKGESIPPVVLSTDTYEDQFWKQAEPLRKAGVPVFRLYS
jgi:glycosyltransferase involved in cell wall biosynthesis